ncbi:TPA: hypothetical protein ACH3X1_002462 [Trebouxia sp. C0004]
MTIYTTVASLTYPVTPVAAYPCNRRLPDHKLLWCRPLTGLSDRQSVKLNANRRHATQTRPALQGGPSSTATCKAG